ncbi:MAG: DUF3995 domain-containing protein [Chloroflexi bacterium AL-W]|nr:DUF3995 domain-containing protein [Chloroflexi bacterium AL-N1]NOK67730.1 DUF3995 domain-containing protein [Chloroflexi bacterium AL-N10]NOK75500.1 DUF3995 domain-containing protein [Chloroflexi bacterium AL-N5]NOK82288.1 DUF3995 domain-containing protein [Chloroflexi bacterium AL-W]NOK90133.1 DUF3995 domain-containing protein [Chloroflexi bacterium AL-N15]
MASLIAVLLATVLLLLSGLHVFWAFGGRWGISAAIPTVEPGDQRLFTPSPLATLAVAMALLVASLLVLLRADILSIMLPSWIPRLGVWSLAMVFALRAIGDFRYVGFFKRVRQTTFARMDTQFYSPLCVLLAVLAGLVGL